MRIVKWALSAVALLLLIVIAAAAALVFFVDPNSFKPEIIQAVKQQTGRELRIEGDLAWSFFPSLGVDIGKTELANAKDFSAPWFAKIERASVSIQIMPLFAGKLQIGTIHLDGVAANLATNKAGVNNWDDLVKANSEPSAKPAAESAAADKFIKDLRLGGIDIKNLALTYADAKNGNKLSLEQLYLQTGAIALGDDIDVSGGLTFKSSADKVDAKLSFSSTFNYGLDSKILKLASLQAKLNASAAALGSNKVKLLLTSAGVVDLNASKAQISQLKLQLDDASLSGKLDASWGQQLAASGNLKLDAIDVDKYLKAMPQSAAKSSKPAAKAADTKIALPIDLLKKLQLKLRLQADKVRVADLDLTAIELGINADAGNIRLEPIGVKIFGASLQAHAELDARPAQPKYSLDASIDSLELQPLLKSFAASDIFAGQLALKVKVNSSGDSVAKLQHNLRGELQELQLKGQLNSPELPKPVALRLNANAEIQGSSESIKLNSLKAGIDTTNIDGSASLVGFSKPVIKFKVDVDDINLDNYISTTAASAKAEPDAGKQPAVDGDAPLLPVKLLQSLNLNGSLHIAKLQVMHGKMQQLRAELSAKDGLITLQPLAMQLYSGSFNGSAIIDARTAVPSIKLSSKLAKVQLQPLLQDMADMDYLEGNTSANLNIVTRGNSKNKLLRGLNGKWDMQIADGKLHSNLLSGLQPLLKLSNRPKLMAAAERSDTPFKTLVSSGSIEDGVIRTNDFELQNADSKFAGGGSLDIATQYLDFGLDVDHDGYSCTIPVKGHIQTLNYKKVAANAVPNCLQDAAKRRANEELDKQKAIAQEKIDAEKAKLQEQADEEKARLQEKIDAEKQRAQEKVKDTLKDLFKK